MSLITYFRGVTEYFGHARASKPHTLVELAEAAESDELDQVLAQAGMPSVVEDEQPLRRRKWSQLERFNRADFDINAYTKSLDEK